MNCRQAWCSQAAGSRPALGTRALGSSLRRVTAQGGRIVATVVRYSDEFCCACVLCEQLLSVFTPPPGIFPVPHWAAITDREDRLTMEDGVPRRDFWGTVSSPSPLLIMPLQMLYIPGGWSRLLVEVKHCSSAFPQGCGQITAFIWARVEWVCAGFSVRIFVSCA